MEKYYEDKYCTIYNGDCREILPELPEVDLVLTDPPYEKEAHTSMKRTRASNEGRRDSDEIPFDSITEELRQFICEIKSNWSIVFCQAEAVYKYSELFGKKRYKRAMVWIKPDSSPQFNGAMPAMGYESIVCAWNGIGRSKWNSGGKRGVYTYNCTSGRFGGHPTEKPLGLMTELINDFHLGGLIRDPFMGSGTTLRAAKDLNRKAIGIELEEKYCEIAAKRLSQEVFDLGI